MEIKTQKTILTTPQSKEKPAFRLYFNCPPKLHSRIMNFSKSKGLKDSTLFLISVDEYLTKNNF